jgi:hypothetical protein
MSVLIDLSALRQQDSRFTNAIGRINREAERVIVEERPSSDVVIATIFTVTIGGTRLNRPERLKRNSRAMLETRV